MMLTSKVITKKEKSATVIWVDHRKMTEELIDYIMDDVQKPFAYTVDQTIQRLALMVEFLKHLPPPTTKGQEPGTIEEWEPKIAVFTAEQTRKMQFRCLPKDFKDDLKDLETDWSDLIAMPNERWLDELRRIKDNQNRIGKAKIVRKYENASDGESSPPSKYPKKVKYQDKPGKKKTWQGEARGCERCKDAGMPPSKYQSHSTSNCKDNWEKKLSGNSADRQDSVKDRNQSWKLAAGEQRRKHSEACEEE